MAAPEERNTKYEERKNQVLLDLPVDFLRIGPATEEQQQLAADEQAAIALQHQMAGASLVSPSVTGRLSISVMEARLVKNYGMTRMDPYVRLKVGATIYETHTDYNGAKNPKWHKVFHSFIMAGVDTISIDIYDECAFTLDERIAWATVPIPEAVFKGESIDQWFPLSGKQGEEKEGTINILLSYQASLGPSLLQPRNPAIPPGAVLFPAPATPSIMMVPAASYYNMVPYGVPPVYPPAATQQPGQPQPVVQPPPPISEEDVTQVHEMFPNLEKEVVRTVLECNRGNKDRTINSLLSLSTES